MSRREREAAAARTLRECRAALAARGSTPLREAIGAGEAGPVDWRHYPDGEVYDPISHLQYFYHRHPPAPTASAAAADGHFHLFLRGEGMPAGIVPMLLPEAAVARARPTSQSAPLRRGRSDKVCHLVAIAIDGEGEPCRLLTTNRWVTGETWYRADDMVAMLDRVRIGDTAAPTLLNRWIEALVHLFQSDIAALLRERDRTIMQWRWRWPRGNVFEDPRLEVTSSCAIDLEARLAAVEAAVVAPAAAPRQPLPAMAEGWGS